MKDAPVSLIPFLDCSPLRYPLPIPLTNPKKPYTPALALSLFNIYADPDTATTNEPTIGPEGFEKLCNDAQIPLDGALPLVLAWMLDAKEMAKIGKGEWIKATGTLQ
jgi:DCN1-like protein 4/5